MISHTIRQIAVTLGAVVCACTVPVWGQAGEGGQVELGLSGLYTAFDDSLDLTSKAGAGGRLGFFFSRVFALEVSGDHTVTQTKATNDQVSFTRIGASFVAYGHIASWNAVYLGVGYDRQYYRDAMNADEGAGSIIVGDRISLGGRVAVRLEGRGSFAPVGTLRTANLSASAGISIFAFGGPARDGDRDGVSDKRDSCPGTPLGVLVDEQGCPVDSDSDGVFDGPDECPGTPAGATVDQTGCPIDDDGDGVFNGIDACPSTPYGATVDDTGCPSDTDGDGVFDGVDLCPDTPLGAEVNESGCPSDADQDGVFDGLDQCPDTPVGASVDETGCPTDEDQDGVLNVDDQCPNTPPNTEVDERGCPTERDSDGDGVPDSSDQCPNTAPGQPVDTAGCPVLFVIAGGEFVTQQGERGPLILRGVNFETSRSRLTQDSYAILDLVAQSLLEYPDVMIEVAGHTDATGTDAINNPLSLNRARAVMAYLARAGVPLERMEARGYGSTQPIASNSTREGRSQNRRVELRVLSGGS
ncbi:MAG: OmpA family protein [Gemmatimonadota bacterium]|nr:MAG: OmpA family protein [Gemmatimonadota bacterium]